MEMERGAHIEHTRWLVAYSLVEDVEVTGHRERNDVAAFCPSVTDLLMIHARPERPSDLCLLRLDIP